MKTESGAGESEARARRGSTLSALRACATDLRFQRKKTTVLQSSIKRSSYLSINLCMFIYKQQGTLYIANLQEHSIPIPSQSHDDSAGKENNYIVVTTHEAICISSRGNEMSVNDIIVSTMTKHNKRK